jgi:hypothetical protein
MTVFLPRPSKTGKEIYQHSPALSAQDKFLPLARNPAVRISPVALPHMLKLDPSGDFFVRHPRHFR